MLESGAIVLGPDGTPFHSFTLEDGTEIYQTGDPEIDRLEREFAESVQREIMEGDQGQVVKRSDMLPPSPPSASADALWYDEEDILGSLKK